MALRSTRTLGGLVAALTLGIAACSDPVTDPSAANALRPAGAHLILATSTVTTAVVDPRVDNLYVSAEGHRLFIPANAICDLTSGYGATYWNLPCAPATAPIVFTITTNVDAYGYSKVTVQPDVRFSPSKTVMAYIHDTVAVKNDNAIIGYCKLLSGCVDEGKTDAAMTTYRDVTQGYLYRRLKHFSGYNVIFGVGCDPTVELCDGGSTNVSRPLPANLSSGYITTVGLGDDDRGR